MHAACFFFWGGDYINKTTWFDNVGVITPAISVLSAVEGIQSQVPSMTREHIVGISVAILFILYMSQRFGTQKIGGSFGPVMLVYFTTIAMLGIYYITLYPGVFASISPHYAVMYFVNHGGSAYNILGFVILSITGCEAMYADVGQFGASAVRMSWLVLVQPALMLQYFGLCAVVLHKLDSLKDGDDQEHLHDFVEHVFFKSIPVKVFWPVLVISLLASVVASQAIITACMEIMTQAMHLKIWPLMKYYHTSKHHYSHVHIPFVTNVMMVVSIAIAAVFPTSESLVSMYGLTISAIMIITTVQLGAVIRYIWGYSMLPVCVFIIFFLFIDCLYFGAVIQKIATGGYVPVTISLITGILMFAYYYGYKYFLEEVDTHAENQILGILQLTKKAESPISPISPSRVVSKIGKKASHVSVGIRHELMKQLADVRESVTVADKYLCTKEGAKKLCVYLTSSGLDHVPLAFLSTITTMGVCAESVCFFQLTHSNLPTIEADKRFKVYTSESHKGPDWFIEVDMQIGYTEEVSAIFEEFINKTLMSLMHPIVFESVFFLSGFHIIISKEHSLTRKALLTLFNFMHENSLEVERALNLPTENTLRIGTNIKL